VSVGKAVDVEGTPVPGTEVVVGEQTTAREPGANHSRALEVRVTDQLVSLDLRPKDGTEVGFSIVLCSASGIDRWYSSRSGL